MGNFTYNANIWKSLTANPPRFLRILACLFLIGSGNNLFAQCPAVNGLFITSVANDQVSFRWNAIPPAGTQYLYAVQTTNTPPATPLTTTDTSVIVTGLSPSTTYFIYVSYQCAGGDPGWTTLSFTTPLTCLNFLQPAITTPNGITAFCPGGSIVISSNSNLLVTNQWFKDDVVIPGENGTSYTATQPGKYALQVSDITGCVNFSNEITITVSPLPPIPTISVSGPSAFCSNDSVILTSSSLTGNQWYRNGNLIVDSTNRTLTVKTAGDYTVQVTNTEGCSSTSAVTTLTVNNAPPKPNITADGPLTFCSNDSVKLTSSAGGGNQWFKDGAPITNAINKTFTANTAGSYTVQVVNGSGCTAVSDPVVIAVNPAPAKPVITAGGPTTICNGDSVKLTSSSAANNQWFKNGNLIADSINQTFTATTAGSYTVQVTNTGCSATSDPVVVTVNPAPPKPNINANGPLTFCSNDSVKLTSSADVGDQWFKDGAPITGAINKTFTTNTAGSYTVQVTNGSGCTAVSDPVVVAVNPAPAKPVITAGGPTTICNGDSVKLTSSSAANNQWFKNGNLIADSINQNFTATTAGSYTVQVTNTGCSATSDPVVVTVNPAPPKPNITADGPLTFCSNDSVKLTSSAGGGNQWFKDGAPITGAINKTFTANTAGSYTVQVVNGSGCTAVSDPVVIAVNPAPAKPVIAAGGPTTICNGDSVILTSSSAANNQWFKNGNLIANSINQTFTATTAGSYTVQVTNTGCSAISDPVVVTVNPAPPKPNITADGPLTFCSDDSVKLTSSAATGNQWLKDGINIQDSVLRTLTVKISGSYNVRVTSAGGCTSISDTTKVTVINLQTPPTITPDGPLTFCNGDSVVLSSSAGTGNQWFKNGTKINGETNQTYNATTSGSYTVQLTSGGGCTVTSVPQLVTVNPIPPKPNINAGGPLTFCSDDSVKLTSSAATGNQWLRDGINIQDSVLRTLTVKISGSYNVRVTSAGGCSSISDTTKVTVINLQTPPTITPDGPLTFCNGDSVVFTSSAGTGNQWFKNGTKINGETNQTYTATTSGSYTVQLTSGGGCTVTSVPQVVTVNPIPPKPNINAGGPLTFCSDDSVKLTSSAATGNQWLKDGINILDSVSQTLTVKISGAYNVRVTSAGGCTSISDTTKVTVINLQTPPTITPDGPLTFCDGDSVVFSSSAGTGNQWFKNGTKINGETNQTYTATTSGSYTVQLTSGGGCTVTSVPQVVTVNPAPPKPNINAGGPLTFCSDDSVKLTSSSATGNQWLKDGINIQDSVSQTLTVKISGAYNVRVTSAGGCTSISDTTKVTVINLQTPPTITPDGPLTFCNGDSVVFSSSAASGNQWFKDGKIINGATLQTYTALTPGSYTVQLTSGGGCTVTSAPQVVTVNPIPPKPNITADGPLTFCSDDSVKLTSSSATGNQWIKDGINIQDSVSQTLTVKISGAYNVRITSAGGCSTISDTTKVTVINLQTPPTITPDGPLTFCSGDSVVLSSTSATGNQWFKDGVIIVGAINQTYSAKLSGSYTVQLTSGGGCTVTSAPLVVTVNTTAPKPAITASGPTTFCSNDSVKLTSSSAAGNQWIKDGINIQDSVSTTLTVKTSGVYQVMVTGACSAISDSVKVTVVNLQTPPVISADGPLVFCDGDSVVFSSTSATGNQWLKDGIIIAGATNQTYAAKLSGTYTVQLSSGGGCTATSAAQVVTVNPVPPKPNITTDGPATFCSDDSVKLTSSSATGNQWLKDGINIPDSVSTTLTVKTSGSYKVIVTNASGCQSVSNALAVSAINNQIPPTISPVGAVTVCSGDSVILSSSSTAGNQWFRDGSIINGATSQTYPATLAGSYTVQVSTQAGCNAESLPKTVIGGTTPDIPVITASDTLINCVYSKVLYSSSASGNLWMRNGVPLNGEFMNYYIVKTTGSFTVQVTSGSGCSSVSAATTILIIINPNTPVITSSDPLSFCDGGSALLHSSPAPGYQWYKDGAPISGASGQDYTANASGAYTVQVTNGTCSFISQPVNVNVINNQTPATITPVGPLNLCNGESIVLSSSSVNGNQWYKDGAIIDGATNQLYSASVAGSYTVKITVGTCSSSFSSPVVITTSNNGTAPTITAGGPLTFCTGGSVLLTSSTASSYQWYKNGTAIPGATDASYTATDAGSYTVNTKNASACGALSDAVVVSLTNTTPPPTIAVVGPGPGCDAGQTVLISSSDLGNQWLKDGVAIPGAVQKTFYTDQTGNYSVALDYGSACASQSQVITIIGNTAGTSLKASISGHNGVLYSDSATGNQWYLNDTLIAGATDSTYIPQVSGKYTLRITNSAGCMSTFSDPYFVKVENFTSPNVLIFPNPVMDYLFIVNQDIHPLTARIFDIEGRQIMIVKGLVGTSQINVSKLSGGSYVVQILDEITNDKINRLILKY